MIEKNILCSKKLYYDDSELYEFDANVISCEQIPDRLADANVVKSRFNDGAYIVELDKTAFFPEGGGQYGDTGFLDDIKVLDTQENDGKILHITDAAPKIGTKVHGIVDKESRFDKMQQHSAEHIVSGLVHKLTGFNNVGFHLGDDITTLDFDGVLSNEKIFELEHKANEAVVQNICIKDFIPSNEEEKLIEYRSKIDIDGEVRLVEIPGYDVCACCAPHVKTTGEIGLIKIINSYKYKNGTRLEMLAGFRALKDYNQKLESAKNISNLLSVPINNVAEATKKLHDDNQKLKFDLIKFQEESLLAETKDLINDAASGVALKISDAIDINVARKFVNSLVENGAKVGAIFVKKPDNESDNKTDNESNNEYQYIIGSKKINLKEYSVKINDLLNGCGGGKPEMIRGSVNATKEEIEEIIKEIFA